ncbi:MAG: glutamate-cysteine ligase family protein [Coriobacteriia bacterium]|nr:glutamate-cysteine ligase family protein [Coriobacteriia bacterium]
MNRQQIRESLYAKYIAPTEQPRSRFIGVEVEIPVVRLTDGPTDYAIAQEAARACMDHFGFIPEKLDANGVCFSATRPDNGDNISFDCSYNNLELSLGRAEGIAELDQRFRDYVGFLNERLGANGHTLTGMGVNPRNAVNRRDFIPSERYRMLERYLQKSQTWNVPMYFHPYVAYGAFASASQVQLDVDRDRLIPTLRAFSNVEPVKAVLFSNALLETEPQLLCVRDLLWENSTHGINPHNIGMFDCRLETVDDLLEYISTTSIFCTERDGRYINFMPIPIIDYLARDQVQGEYYADGAYHPITFKPQDSDLAYLRTYKFEDLTFRGTIEFRSCCCQPLGEAMTVAAFHVGLMDQVDELNRLLDADHVLFHHGYSATELRRIFNHRQWPQFVDRDALRQLCLDVLDLAARGLEARGKGESHYLDPLFERARTLTSPGRAMADALDAGEPLQDLIRRYAAL